MKMFHCDRCRQLLYFENARCLACGSEIGFLPDAREISSLKGEGENRWEALAPQAVGKRYRKCANYLREGVCNWMVPSEDPHPYCLACRLNLTIPNLDKKPNRLYWYRLEGAKRRLLYGLLKLGLPIVSREADPDRGLAFRFLEDEEIQFKETQRVMTGHANGVITINVLEADDASRVQMQLQMYEEYRTVLGHFRHEIGHYYWARLIEEGPRLEGFRALFGDERVDYTKALERYYEQGPPADWRRDYVSAYSASHPWEDWAETWAHYLHMTDTLETARGWGLSVRPQAEGGAPVLQQAQQGFPPDNPPPGFDAMYQSWTWITCAINSMNRSVGQADFYPFVLSRKAVEKLRFVDTVIKLRGNNGRED